MLFFVVVLNPLSVHLRPVSTTTAEQANSKQRTKKAEPGKRWEAGHLDEQCESSEADAGRNILVEEQAAECSDEMDEETEEEEEED